MLSQQHVRGGDGYQGSVGEGDTDLCIDRRDPDLHCAFHIYGLLGTAHIFHAEHRNGHCLQYGYQLFFRGDFLYYKSAQRGSAARGNHGLFHFPLAQLSGEPAAL